MSYGLRKAWLLYLFLIHLVHEKLLHLHEKLRSLPAAKARKVHEDISCVNLYNTHVQFDEDKKAWR